MKLTIWAIAPLALGLAACSSAPSARPQTPTGAPPPRAARPLPKPKPIDVRGLESVIGQDANALTRMFGKPRLDIQEGSARKLQFQGQRCVMDAYLYPPAPGKEPVTTHIDARRSDGQEVDRAACVASFGG